MIQFFKKRNIFILFTIYYLLFTISLMPVISFAAAGDPSESPIQSINDIIKILDNIAKWMYTIFFIVAAIFILIAAYNFLFAQGNPEKITSARKQVTYAVIAIIIALVAASFVYLIKDILS